jgi:GrpB-like predicted nucleotidyltransferase (UPF0157 family)
VPFADENWSVAVVAHRPEWADEFAELAREVRATPGGAAVVVDHVGSTSVPGLAARTASTCRYGWRCSTSH